MSSDSTTPAQDIPPVVPRAPPADDRANPIRTRSQIVDWVRGAADELHADCPQRLNRDRLPHGYTGTREITIDGMRISLTRIVHWSENGRHDGRLFPYRVVGNDVEERRRARIARALERKLPKLQACRDEGDVSIPSSNTRRCADNQVPSPSRSSCIGTA